MRKSALACLVAVISFLVALPGFADPPVTGRSLIILRETCSGDLDELADEETTARACGKLYGFVQGAIDGIVTGAGMTIFQNGLEEVEPLCVPDGTKVGEVHESVFEYIEQHPDQWDKDAAPLIALALMHRYPCQAGPGPDVE